MTRDRVVQSRSATPIGNMNEIDAGLLAEELERQMADAAAADRRIADAPGLFLGGADQLRKVAVRSRRMGCHHIGSGCDQRDRVEILVHCRTADSATGSD